MALVFMDTFPRHHVQDAGLQQHRVAFGRHRHRLGRLEQVKHVGLRTEVQLRGLFLHVNVDAVNAAPDALRRGSEGSRFKVLQRVQDMEMIELYNSMTKGATVKVQNTTL